MVADFMRNHVALGKIAVGAQLAFHVVIEGEIDIDGAVRRAVERPHNGLPGATAGAGCAPVHHQFWRLISPPHFSNR